MRCGLMTCMQLPPRIAQKHIVRLSCDEHFYEPLKQVPLSGGQLLRGMFALKATVGKDMFTGFLYDFTHSCVGRLR